MGGRNVFFFRKATIDTMNNLELKMVVIGFRFFRIHDL